MLKIKKFSSKGVKTEDFVLPKEMEVGDNAVTVSQAVRVLEDKSHKGLSKVKTRSEVAISTRKIYRQKGTGGARHGAKSAPIFAGGGVTHGPKGFKRILKLPRNLKKFALYSAINTKIKAGEVYVLENMKTIMKTKDANLLLGKIVDAKKKGKFLLALASSNKNVKLAFRNLKNVNTVLFHDINALQVVNHKYVILDEQVFASEKTETVKAETKKAVKGSKGGKVK